jgi:hypothetical protein
MLKHLSISSEGTMESKRYMEENDSYGKSVTCVRNMKKIMKNLNFALACCVNGLQQCIPKQNL